jgi:uncharacterized membrane protein
MSDDQRPIDPLNEILGRLKELEGVVRDQKSRLEAIEHKLGVKKSVDHKEIEQGAVDQSADVLDEIVRAVYRSSDTPPPPGGENRQGRGTYVHLRKNESTSADSKSTATNNSIDNQGRLGRLDLESRIGGSWFNRIGVLAICIGVGFFLKLAFDREWIGPLGRVSMGVAIGLAFLTGGERLRKRYAGYAYGLSGGGVLILYLSFFAAYNTYRLAPRLVAFILMAAVTATASLLAARYSALPIAILGLIGGFLTPILLSTGVDNQIGLFGYLALLDLGVLALATSKQWRVLNYLSFVATVLMIAGWMLAYWAPDKLWTTFFFLTLFFVVFALLSVIYNVINRQPTGWLDLVLVFVNALFYFGTSYELLDDQYHRNLGLFAILVSTFYLGLGFFTYRRDREDRRLILIFLGLAFLFLVLAVPIQFDQQWVTMAWAIEGSVMTWIGLKVNDKTSRYAAFLLLIIAVSHWALFDVQEFAYQSDGFMPLFNPRSVACAVLVAALAVCGYVYKRHDQQISTDERSMYRGIYLLGANALAVILVSLDINSYFDSQRASLGSDVSDPRLSAQQGVLSNNKQLALTVWWTAYASAALNLGIVRNQKYLRVAAMSLLLLAGLKVLVNDLQYYDAEWHTPFLNQTFAAFAILVLAILIFSKLYEERPQIDARERRLVSNAMIAAANVLLIVAISAEASGYFKSQMSRGGELSDSISDLRFAEQLSLSLIWAVYGGGMLVFGIARRSKLLRVMALALLGITIFKVFLLDLASLDRVYRIISFIVLGAILLAVSFLYQRYRHRSGDLLDDAEPDPTRLNP